MRNRLLTLMIVLALVVQARAVTSKVVRHDNAGDFQKGRTAQVTIGSEGALALAPETKVIASELPDAWTVNALITDTSGALYIGTSPNGAIYRYANGVLKKLYPTDANTLVPKSEPNTPPAKDDANSTAAAKDVNDANALKAQPQKYLTNEHIFAFGLDSIGRVLAGVSGKNCRLLRINGDRCDTIFEPNDADYIFAIATDERGNTYIATGPHGNIYQLEPSGKTDLLYHAADKNILSLIAGLDSFLYAGSDDRGIVYRIDPLTKSASVLYSAGSSEITSMLFDAKGSLYAAATSASVTKGQRTVLENLPGKPEAGPAPGAPARGTVQLIAPNMPKRSAEEEQTRLKSLFQQAATASAASHIYKIDPAGYVTDVFKDAVVFFGIAARDNQILIATGSKGQLLGVDTATERKEIVYADPQATQVTALFAGRDAVYFGTANPAKVLSLAKSLAPSGTYSSALIDAGQPAKWGKLQVEADIPAGTSVQVSARTGNVNDINDPTFSAWTQPRDVNMPVQLDVPLGRFCQYKLLFTGTGQTSPIVRQVAVPYMIPNLAPQVDAVTVSRSDAPDKPGIFTITFKASDRNSDKLIYRIDIRRLGRENWIKLKDNLDTDSFTWDSKTVEDGRYEIKVTASDERSNTQTTKLADSRISDPVIVDNTPPAIADAHVEVSDKTAVIKFSAIDKLSTIASVSYTVDSNADWIGTLPQDSVYDTLSENFTITAADLSPGQHVIAVKVTDAAGNAMYKTFEVEIK